MKRNKKVIRLTESDLVRIVKKVINEQKVLNEQAGLLRWLWKKSAGKIGQEAAEAIAKKLPSSWTKYHGVIMDNIISKNTDGLSGWVSASSGKPAFYDDLTGLINRQLDDIARDPSEATLNKVVGEMKFMPRTIKKPVGGSGKEMFLDFREPYKEYLESIVKSAGKSGSKVTNLKSFMQLIRSGSDDVLENIGKTWKSASGSGVNMTDVSQYILKLEKAAKAGKITKETLSDYISGLPRKITDGVSTFDLRSQIVDYLF